MKTRWVGLFALCCVVATPLAGQDEDTLRSFRTPASPAFVLIGAAPTAVERPGTPQSLVLSLISSLQDNHFPPKRYALEIAPYWLTRHRTMTFEQYAAPGFWQSVIQTLSISVATTSVPAPDSGTVLSFGLRTGYFSNRDLSIVRALRDSLDRVTDSALVARTADARKRWTNRAQHYSLRIQRALREERLGWTVQLATAGAFDFAEDVAQNGKVSRAGVWLTSGYRLAKPRADLLTVVRYTLNERAAPNENFLDLGGRLVFDRDELALSAEYVFRSVTAAGTSRNTYRLTAGADYRLAQDIYVTAAIGRGADENGPDTAPLVAQIGIDFGLGPILLIPRGRHE